MPQKWQVSVHQKYLKLKGEWKTAGVIRSSYFLSEIHIYMLHTCMFLVSSLSFYMNLIVQKTVTWIFTKCLLRTKQFLSCQHSHLASMLYCCCWFSWVLLCWPQTIYWSLLRKPLLDLKQRKYSCSPNDWSFYFIFFLERTVLGGCVYFVFEVFLPCTSYHWPDGHELEQALEVGDG